VNRKQKYGGHRANELAVTDFLFDFVYIMGSISTLNGILYPALLPLAHYKGVFHLARISIVCEFFLAGARKTIFADLTQMFPSYTDMEKHRITVKDRAGQRARFRATSLIF